MLQPSPLVGLLSSHASLNERIPSPHTLVQVLRVPVQRYPGSMRQVGEQPSPARRFPSSHCSPPSTVPSPQARACSGRSSDTTRPETKAARARRRGNRIARGYTEFG
jgi:hypothetical protein